MRSVLSAVCLALLTLNLSAQEASPPATNAEPALPPAVLEAPFPPTAESLKVTVKHLASPEFEGRDAGSPGGRRAAAWIAHRFKLLGLRPLRPDGSYEQEFNHRRVTREDGKVRIRPVGTRNVVAWLPGSSEKEHVIVGAHFDHLGRAAGAIHPGADDNASGVAGLLAIAEALARRKQPLRRAHFFIAFGAEERGLQGSSYYVEHPARPLTDLVLMINLDMIGRPRFLDRRGLGLLKRLAGIRRGPGVGIVGGAHSPQLLTLARAACQADSLPCYAPQDFGPFKEKIQSQVKGRSDHAPFEARRIPHLFFSTSEHDDYHRPTDTPDKTDGKVMRRVARAVHRTLLAVDAEPQRPAWKRPRPR